MTTLNAWLQDQYESGYGVALIDSKTKQILTPYLGSEYGSEGWDSPSDFHLDGDMEMPPSFVSETGWQLIRHSGGIEEEYYGQLKQAKVRP